MRRSQQTNKHQEAEGVCWSGNARDREVTCTQTNKCAPNHSHDNLEHVQVCTTTAQPRGNLGHGL
jgi:hypothetical protein